MSEEREGYGGQQLRIEEHTIQVKPGTREVVLRLQFPGAGGEHNFPVTGGQQRPKDLLMKVERVLLPVVEQTADKVAEYKGVRPEELIDEIQTGRSSLDEALQGFRELGIEAFPFEERDEMIRDAVERIILDTSAQKSALNAASMGRQYERIFYHLRDQEELQYHPSRSKSD